MIASSKGLGVGALPETASSAALAFAAALPFKTLALVTLALLGFFVFTETVFLAMPLFVSVVAFDALEEIFLTVAFFVDGGFFAIADFLRLFEAFFALGTFFAGTFCAFSLIGDMGGIVIGIVLLDKF